MPSAFFSVSGSAAGTTARDQANAHRVLTAFLAKTGWRPRAMAAIAGAMAFTKYGMVTRVLLTLISRRAGGPTDSSRDHELTDWAQVVRFAIAFGASLDTATAAGFAQT